MGDPSRRAHLALAMGILFCSLLVTLSAWADQPRIAVLAPSIPNSPQEAGLREGLHQLGYTEGKDVSIDWIQSPRTNDEFRLRAADAVRLKPNLIATYVDKVLRGSKPSELPIEQDATYELIINLRVARELGIEVPQELLFRANELIR